MGVRECGGVGVSEEAREYGAWQAQKFAAWMMRRARPGQPAQPKVAAGPARGRLTLAEEAERRHQVVMDQYAVRLREAFGVGEFRAADVREKLGMHESSVKKALRKLTEDGVVVRVRQVRTGERGGLPWLYRVGGSGSVGDRPQQAEWANERISE